MNHEDTEAHSEPEPFDAPTFCVGMQQAFGLIVGLATVTSTGNDAYDDLRIQACLKAVLVTLTEMCVLHHLPDETPADCARRMLDIHLTQHPELGTVN